MAEHPEPCRDQHTRLTAAAINGFVAGVARAVADWILHHLTNTW